MKLHLSDTGAAADLSVLIDSRLLVQANSGGGKSWALRRLLEQSHGHVQQLVIDPEGEFGSLRERFDYVLAAKGGDTSADPRAARLLAERLLELGVSAILDIYELKAHDRVRFVRAFVEALVDAPKALWHPALVVVDEAHVFCPQAGEAESAGAVIDLATRGRKRGFCAVLATQRLSKLHKDAAAECNNKLIGRTGLDVDVKRAADELGFGKERWRELRELEPGEFFAFGPALSREVAKLRVGAVQTRHPVAGARLAAVPVATPSRIKALLPKLADLPAEAEQKAKSEADLRRRIADLEREVRQAKECQKNAIPIVERIEVPVFTEHERDEIRLTRQILDDIRTQFIAIEQRIASTVRPPVSASVGGRNSAADRNAGIREKIRSGDRRARHEEVARAGERRRSASEKDAGAELSGPEQRILDAIAWLEQVGVVEPEQPAVAFLAGYTYGGGAFNNPRGRLNVRGLVEYRGDRIRLTEAGRGLANTEERALDIDELHRRVLNRLPGPEQRVLKPLLMAYPEPLSNEDLARASGYTPNAGAFNNPRGRLRSLGLIEYPRPGAVVARPLLFLEGA